MQLVQADGRTGGRADRRAGGAAVGQILAVIAGGDCSEQEVKARLRPSRGPPPCVRDDDNGLVLYFVMVL